ncbi:hypothetical protein E2562_022616 [Oryza meyeriana var. granulata]|uniref:NAC domain-containing protein n=1 Tax=Oryza meyeriana var. granulata TaxID=110450 RepID=A0A6G1CS39_9ORYZ|nr:hypothetical protein E2562_022616 [Oryza meyeriana var. granulata]
MADEMPGADGKPRSASSGFQPSAPPQPQQYGTFGAPSGPSELPQPAVGSPQPAPPPGFRHYPQPPPASYAVYPPPPQTYPAAAPYYAQGYQAVQGYIPVVEGRPVRMRRLPCCGLGMGWFLFIIGFFLAAIPWYVGAFVLICVRVHDYREKPGYVACTIAELVESYLLPRVVSGDKSSCGFIHEADVYSADPAGLTRGFAPAVARSNGDEAWYFFSAVRGLKRRRKARTVDDGAGCWHSEASAMPSFSFMTKDNGGQRVRSGWLMVELSLGVGGQDDDE